MCLTETYSKICVSKNIRYISYSEWSGTRRYSVAIAFQIWCRIFHQYGHRKL